VHKSLLCLSIYCCYTANAHLRSWRSSVSEETTGNILHSIFDCSESLKILVSELNVEFVLCFKHNLNISERVNSDVLPCRLESDLAWIFHLIVKRDQSNKSSGDIIRVCKIASFLIAENNFLRSVVEHRCPL